MRYDDEDGDVVLSLGEALMAGQAGSASNVIGDVVVLVRTLQDTTYRAEICHDGGRWEEQTFATLEDLEAAYPKWAGPRRERDRWVRSGTRESRSPMSSRRVLLDVVKAIRLPGHAKYRHSRT